MGSKKLIQLIEKRLILAKDRKSLFYTMKNYQLDNLKNFIIPKREDFIQTELETCKDNIRKAMYLDRKNLLGK